MVKLYVSELRVDLDPTGSKSRVYAGDIEITGMCDTVDVHTDAKSGTTIKLRYALADCRAAGHGCIMAPHPDTSELLEVEEIRFRDGSRWKAVVEEKSK